MKMIAFNFSDAYREQGFVAWAGQQAAGNFLLADCTDVEGCTCYCDAPAAREIEARLPAVLPQVRWLDSGDYHYLSFLLSLREKEPFHLVLLDNHPDDQEPAFGGVLSCGSWVREIREKNPMLRDVVSIGPEGEGYRIPEGWIEKRRGERVYISLDKDIMGKAWARTDWSQGEATLQDVQEMLSGLMEGMEVTALDICGELSSAKGATPEDLRINFETNIDLYRFIENYLK